MIAARLEDGPQLLRFERNQRGRDLAVGDVHGCFAALQVALDTIGFLPAVDRLFCTGDLVDRGPESHAVEAWLDQPWFFSVLGNHEFMAVQQALEGPLALSNYRAHGGGWLLDLPRVDQVRIGQCLGALPLAIQVDTLGGPVGLIHADFPTGDWRHIDVPFSEDDRQIALWSTLRFDRRDATPVRNVRALLHGHVTLSVAQRIANVYFIDTGGWLVGRGHFTFVDLESLELIHGPGPNASFRSQRNR